MATVEVITPTSPLGVVLLGARPGDELTYKVASGARITVSAGRDRRLSR